MDIIAGNWLVAYYGIVKTGAVINPINVMLTPEKFATRSKTPARRAIVCVTRQGRAPAGSQRCQHSFRNRAVGEGSRRPAPPASREWARARERKHSTPLHRDPGDLASICYTSGTTGFPKGAMQSHRSVIYATIGTGLMAARGPTDRFVSSLPCPHVYGSCVSNSSIMAGGTFIMVPRFEERAVLKAVSEHRATMIDGVPTVYYYLLAHPDFEKIRTSPASRDAGPAVRQLPAAKSLEFSERTGCPVHEVWGMTELAGPASANPAIGPNKRGTIGMGLSRQPDACGRHRRPIEGPRSWGAGRVVMFEGPMVMDGSYGNEKATRETIEANGWLHSGDIATVDEDGYFTIVDRKKDMILTAGFNVYPAELERVICMHPAVALAAVRSVPDEAKGELAKAYVILKAGQGLNEVELVQHCRQHLAAYKVLGPSSSSMTSRRHRPAKSCAGAFGILMMALARSVNG